MTEINNYKVSNMIYNGTNTVIYKATEKETNQEVIIKVLKSEYPTPEELKQFTHEFEIAKYLNGIKGVITDFDIIDYQNTKAIIMEDIGAHSLDMSIKNKTFPLKEALEIAIKTTAILGEIHKSNVIHKDIKPQNILLNEETGDVRIIDFGLSTQLSREIQSVINPGHLEGTLSYISPEQTGRMNRSIDYRTDFYSLGITLYELFTGQKPFNSNDPMELVHSHIAKTPAAPHKANSDIPEIVSKIIMKLLKKTAEERYQSTHGIIKDLENCNSQLSKKGLIEDFEIAQNDRSDSFHIPEKLYGRKTEASQLLETFESCSQGNREILFISGLSGIGKSTLVNELHKPIVEKRGYFIAGKHELLKMNIPYKAIIQAFKEIIKEILTESNESLTSWKEKILDAIGDNASVITDIISEVELIIGEQPPVQPLPAAESQNRFNLVFLNFIKVFAQKEHPLVLFIDDLQWADNATLNFLKVILTDSSLKYFLLFGAYRHNEIDKSHQFSLMCDSLKKENISWKDIRLEALKENDIVNLLSDTLHSDNTKVQPLAQLIYTKTGGNPFFIKEFLKKLYESKLINFKQGWQWELSSVKQAGITENVVDLMAEKIKSLPSDTWSILKIACCKGVTFDIKDISQINNKTEIETLKALTKAINEGIITKVDNTLNFVHDKVREAAYSIIDEDEKINIHHKIGITILKNSDLTKNEEVVFTIANQLNLAIKLLNSEEKAQLIDINLKAGIKAKSSTAYSAAVDFFESSIKILQEDSWTQNYTKTFSLYSELSEVKYLAGNYEDAEQLFETALEKSQNKKDKVKIYSLQIAKDCALSKFSEALEKGQKALQLLDVDFDYSAPETLFVDHMTKVGELLNGRQIEELIDLPEMQDEGKIAAMNILNACAIPSYYTVPAFFPIIVMKMIILSLQYGNCPLSAYAYSLWGYTVSGALNDLATGYQYSNFSIKLADKYNNKSILGKTIYMYSVSAHWKRLLIESLDYGLRANQYLLETGDFNLLGLSHIVNSYLPYFSGQNLKTIKEVYSKTNIALKRLKQKNAIIMAFNYTEAVSNLLGESGNTIDFKGEELDDSKILEIYKNEKDMGVIGHYSINKVICCYIFESYDTGKIVLQYEAEALAGLFGNPCIPIFHFFHAITLTAVYSSSSEEERKALLEKINTIRDTFKPWAEHGTQNYMHKYKLILAEIARITDAPMEEVAALYDEAITGAKKNHFTHEEAIANECAAKYYLSKGRDKIAKSYMIEARYCYIKWGCKPKVELLEAKYPDLFSSLALSSASTADLSLGSISAASVSTRSSSGALTTVMLDMNTIMKASQTIAGEIEMESLLSRFMKIVIENAGAQKGLLVFKGEDDSLLIEAEREVDKEEVSILKSIPLEESSSLSPAIVRYVDKTKETLVLDNASEEGTFTRDDYVTANKTVSVLCIPVIKQDRIIAILYLENNLSPGTFTPSRVETLRVLSSQAAISIENARMIEQMKEKERLKREMELAERLQTSLVPPAPKHDELDIAVCMKPAEEVGGDYYDTIFDKEKKLWIAIGDVSGHGMTPGIVMMMAETSFHTHIIDSEGKTPRDAVIAVNKVLTENIRTRLKEKHFMTMSFLKYNGTGQFSYSGAHLDIIVYRKATGKVELFKTEGLYLGIMPDMSKIAKDREFNLDVGDVVVLYTDGIIEAPKEDDKENQFGKDTLIEIVEKHGSENAETIMETIKRETLNWCGTSQDDDITMVVAKRDR